MNFTSFISLQKLDAGVYTVLCQGKILTTALFSVVILKKEISIEKWFWLVVLFAGVSLITYNVTNRSAALQGTAQDVLIGVGLTSLQVSLSGLISVYFELVM